MPDAIFAEPRLAEVYDQIDGDRSDLDAYVALVDEFGARRILDLGCGTGNLACLLAGRGFEVIGVDPAAASLDVARQKPNAGRVTWVLADATGIPAVGADLATMTGNVAQVFLTDDQWLAALDAVRAALRPGGVFVFETRDPARRAWEAWHREVTERELLHPRAGRLRTWTELVDVRLPLVSFRHVVEFESDGAVLVSDSTLRFRDRDEIDHSLRRAGFTVLEVRDAPDRPGLEFVFVVQAF